MHIRYRESESFPGVFLFRCEKLHADLEVTSCAKNYLAGASMSCAGCSIGKHHAQRADLPKNRVATRGRRWDLVVPGECCRCLAKGLRLVRGKTICITCYNREREVLHGANAKGAQPSKWSHLRPAIACIQDGNRLRLLEFDLCSGLLEAERTAARRWPGSTVIDFHMDRDPAPRQEKKQGYLRQSFPKRIRRKPLFTPLFEHAGSAGFF